MFKRALVVFTLLCSNAFGQGLYGALPPPDATFVRVVDVGNGAGTVAIGSDASLELPAGSVTSYVMLTAGPAELGGATVALAPQNYYTLVLGANGQGTVLEDKASIDRSKATIEFFNLSELPALDLAVASGSPVIFEGVEQSQSDIRKVNPRSVGFALVSEGAIQATSDEISLERGKVYSVFALGAAGALNLVVVENANTP